MNRAAAALIASVSFMADGLGGEPASVAVECRVESEVRSGEGKEPVARSLTLFRDGVAWDFLEPSGDAVEGGLVAEEIVLHDPSRGRVVLVDPKRNVKTTVETRVLGRLAESLSAWARKSDDDVVRWAGGPDFEDGFDAGEGTLALHGPRVRYAVAFEEAPADGAAEAYRKFADTSILLKALVRPGGLPPFPRMAINDRVAAAGGIPREVTLEVDSKLGPSQLAMPGLPAAGRLTSAHRVHPRWIDADRAKVEAAMARIAVAREVPLVEYARQAHEPDAAKPPKLQ